MRGPSRLIYGEFEPFVALGARAFTVGQDIAFGGEQYRPHTSEGDYLIAHELAHTAQQRTGLPGAAPGPVDGELERQADRSAAAAVTGRAGAAALALTGESEVRVQRLPAVVAGAILLAEATPEIIVASEIGADVVLVDGAIEAAPLVLESAPILESAAPILESAAPVLESTAPVLESTAAGTSATSSTLATAGTVSIAAASATLSSDSPASTGTTQQQQPEDEDQTQQCPKWAPPNAKPIRWPVPTWLGLGHGDPGATSLLYDAPGPPLVSTPGMVDNPVIKVGSPSTRDTSIIRDYKNAYGPASGVPMSEIRIHHKQPLFLDGIDDTPNLVILSFAEHVAWHNALYRQPACSGGWMLNDPTPQPYCIVGVKPVV